MTEIDPTTEQAQAAIAAYEEVFGEIPEIAIVRHPCPDGRAVVVAGWLYLFRTLGTRWSVRIVLADPWFARYPCFSRQDGYEIEKPSFDEALIYVLQHEAHRRYHTHRGSSRCYRST